MLTKVSPGRSDRIKKIMQRLCSCINFCSLLHSPIVSLVGEPSDTALSSFRLGKIYGLCMRRLHSQLSHLFCRAIKRCLLQCASIVSRNVKHSAVLLLSVAQLSLCWAAYCNSTVGLLSLLRCVMDGILRHFPRHVYRNSRAFRILRALEHICYSLQRWRRRDILGL